MKIKSLCLATLGALAIGCGNAQDNTQQAIHEGQILATWSLRSLNDSGTQININDATDASPAFIEFNTQDFNGNTGCNSFFGSYEIRGNQINISKSGMTRMMCAPASMAIEDTLIKLINDGTSNIQVNGNTLTIQKDALKATFSK